MYNNQRASEMGLLGAPHAVESSSATNVRQLTCKMVCSVSFYSLTKRLDFKRQSWGKSVKQCGKVWKSAEMILPFSCCPLVFL